jgi:hypothetical protein
MQLELFPEAVTRAGPTHSRWAQWLVAAILLLFFFWACWATGRILAYRERPVATVDLARVMSDYIRAESARDLPPQEAALRAAMFARLAEEGVAAMTADGTLVLVSQAVVGRSVRDATPDLIRFIDARMAETPSAPALPAAQTPALADPEPATAAGDVP